MSKYALLFGNGVNLYAGSGISWRDLLSEITSPKNCYAHNQFWDGLTETELYDLAFIERKEEGRGRERELPRDIVQKLNGLQDNTPYRLKDNQKVLREMMSSLAKRGTSILTTNIDHNLEDWAGIKIAKQLRPYSAGACGCSFSYPWDRYFSDSPKDNPFEAFSIWHINGMWCYLRSLKFSHAQYMNNVRLASNYISAAADSDRRNSLYACRDNFEGWPGSKTWLRFFFDRPIVIAGLALDTNESFLRWLLIQRAKFFQEGRLRGLKVFSESPRIYFLCLGSDALPLGKLLFFNRTGIIPCKFSSYEAIYTFIRDNEEDLLEQLEKLAAQQAVGLHCDITRFLDPPSFCRSSCP